MGFFLPFVSSNVLLEGFFYLQTLAGLALLEVQQFLLI